MASITSSSSSPTPTTHFNFPNSKLCSSFHFSFSPCSLPLPSISHAVSNSLNKFNSYFNSLRCSASVEDAEWDWEQWRHHFHEVDEQERLLHILKSRFGVAVNLEDYDDAAALKVAIAAIATNDTVGTVISLLNRAIEEERYSDAAFFRDEAGTGLVGWWAGMSKDTNGPRGLIIRITPEHGRYVARSYSPRQLATSAAGVPLFEFFLIKNKSGEFKSQAVYFKQRGDSYSPPTKSTKALDAAERLSSVESPEDKSELFVESPEDPEVIDDRNDSSDPTDGMPVFQNILKDTIPGVKMKVLKFTTPDKVDKDIISDVIEQITEEKGDEDEDEDVYSNKDNETETPELKDVESETDDENELRSGLEAFDLAEEDKAVKAVIGGLVQKISSSLPTRELLLRVPAKLEMSGHGSFLFTIKELVNEQVGHGKGKRSPDKSTKIQGQHSVDSIMFNLAKFIGKGKLPSKVLKDLGELVRRNLSRDGPLERLSGSTMFSRIEIPTSLDPLNGLYISAHGLYSSEVIQLRCRYGHWQEDGGNKESSDLEFYQYVEALKLTGDPYVPAGQVAFRAKVGKRHQLPLGGIIPEEFGLIARYKGQGRLAEPKFQNPRWVDGELVILNRKYNKIGPVIGFVYWVPERPFLVLFTRLRLQE
ncbi:protein EXECUTER 1, chloroplastic-like [Vigna unguiculata]|uniref:protein EXECUTER 1, chloroplastic-like n=1 Tax=Vigna unguiculata TaxID=3917 RepID=UPI001016CD02|nr:protein EXECUTER 1, chloroplastic-like [Vigna unguiculata]